MDKSWEDQRKRITDISLKLRKKYYESLIDESCYYATPHGIAGNMSESIGSWPEFIFRGTFCRRTFKGYCSPCFYSQFPIDKKEVGQKYIEMIRKQFDYVINNFDELVIKRQYGIHKNQQENFITFVLTPTGSYFDDKEFPQFLRIEMLNKLVQKAKQCEMNFQLLIECHCKDWNYDITWSGDIFAFWLDSNTEIPDEWDINSPAMNALTGVNITSLIEDIESKKGLVPKSIDDIESFLGNLNECDVFSRIFKEYVISIYEQMKNSEQEWIDRNIVFVEQNPEMDASMCASYMKKLRNIPEYISASLLERVRRAEQIVTKRLHFCKVEGVVSLYMSLTEGEKEEFKRIINKDC